MAKPIIEQYISLKKEIKDLQRRKDKTNNQITKIQQEGVVIDSVKGTRKDGTFGSIKIEGFPLPKLETKVKRLNSYMDILEEKELKLIEMVAEVETFINNIGDSRTRMIVRYRVIDDLSWVAVAEKMGGGNTEDGVRKIYERSNIKN